MPWVKFSDDWYDDPAKRVAGASANAVAMYAVGRTWCGRNLTDGFIPHGQHALLVNLGENVRPDDVAAELVSRAAWKEVPGGWEEVDYLVDQPSRAEVLARREKDRERKRSQRSDEPPSGVHEDSDGSLDPPVPVPVDPPVVVSPSGRDAAPQPVDDDRAVLKREAWALIAAWKAEQKSKVGNAGWLRSVIGNQPNDEHPDGGTFDQQADLLVDRYDLTARQLAEALVGRLSKRSLSLMQRRAS